jgi:hypothetical protein
MWLFSFVLGVTTGICLLIYGWATYLERAHAAKAQADAIARAAPPPLPKPGPLRPKVTKSSAVAPVEVVREPKIDWAALNAKRYGRYNKWRPRPYAKSRRAKTWETW